MTPLSVSRKDPLIAPWIHDDEDIGQLHRRLLAESSATVADKALDSMRTNLAAFAGHNLLTTIGEGQNSKGNHWQIEQWIGGLRVLGLEDEIQLLRIGNSSTIFARILTALKNFVIQHKFPRNICARPVQLAEFRGPMEDTMVHMLAIADAEYKTIVERHDVDSDIENNANDGDGGVAIAPTWESTMASLQARKKRKRPTAMLLKTAMEDLDKIFYTAFKTYHPKL